MPSQSRRKRRITGKKKGTEQPQLNRQVKRKAEEQKGKPDRRLGRRRRIQSDNATTENHQGSGGEKVLDTGAGVSDWLDASDDEGTDEVVADGRGGTQAPGDAEATHDGRGGTQAPGDAAADVVRGTKRIEARKCITDGSSKRHKSVNGKVASAGSVPCCTRSESYNGEVAPSDSALLTGGVVTNGAKDTDDEREPQQKVRKLRTDMDDGPHECLRGELAGVGGRCTGNRSSPEQALKPAVAGSSVRP